MLLVAPTSRAQSPTTSPTTQTAVPPDTADAPVSPSGQAVVRIIMDLDNADFEVRKTAALRLNSLGGAALPAVEAAIKAQLASPESRIRLENAAKILGARARLEQRYKGRHEWKIKQFYESYLKVGRSNPIYDPQVKTAMDRFWTLGLDPLQGPEEPRLKAIEAFKAAIDAGCEDPLVHCMYYLAMDQNGPVNGLRPDRSLETAFHQLDKSEYPAVIKFWATWRFIRVGGMFAWDAARGAPALVPQIAATPGLPPAELDVNAEQLYDALARSRGSGAWREYSAFLDAYTRAAAPNTLGPMVMRGRVLIDKAWSARGDGWANTVTPQGWKAFYECLDEAEKTLERARKIDPGDPRAPTLMITVKLGQGDRGGGRDAMETWFTRAMEANPDNHDACRRKLYYLYPRWHGDHEQMLEFGRWCLRTENWRGGIPFVLIEAHEAVVAELGDRKAYYERPDVWRDIKDVYEGCLVNFPNAHLQRNQYAKIATQCGKWDVAHAQFQILGDKAIPDVFGSETTLNYLKRKAARLAKSEAKQ
jgi:hypothetical protein